MNGIIYVANIDKLEFIKERNLYGKDSMDIFIQN